MSNKVLILTNSIGGLYNFRREVIKAIRDAGYYVSISYPDIDDKRGEYFETIGCERIPTLFNRRGKNPFSDFGLLVKYIRLIKKIKPKAVLTYTIKPNVYGGLACRFLNVPQLANVTGLGDAVENGGAMGLLTLTLYRFGISKSYRTFFQNASNRKFCIDKKIASTDSILLPGSGVNVDFHNYQDYPNDGAINFLYIGRIMRDKGSAELLEMAEVVKARHPEVSFKILGSSEGGFELQMEKLINNGVISFTNHSLDVRPFLKEAHCTIMPSYHEGMSNVNLESAANGRPIITTNVPGCRETVDDGVTGFIVNVRDTEDLIKKVEKFIALPYEQKKEMGFAGRRKMEKEFNRAIVVNSYLKVINEIK